MDPRPVVHSQGDLGISVGDASAKSVAMVDCQSTLRRYMLRGEKNPCGIEVRNADAESDAPGATPGAFGSLEIITPATSSG